MLLGIVLHAALSFAPIPWPVQDSQQSGFYYVLFACIHGFRMPLFFMLSGFFTAMLWRKTPSGAHLEMTTRFYSEVSHFEWLGFSGAGQFPNAFGWTNNPHEADHLSIASLNVVDGGSEDFD